MCTVKSIIIGNQLSCVQLGFGPDIFYSADDPDPSENKIKDAKSISLSTTLLIRWFLI